MKHPSQEARNRLYVIAEGQGGYFTAGQAEEAGFIRTNHTYHVNRGHWQREGHGIYRLVHYPVSEGDNLICNYLWSRNRAGHPQGVYSHQTALHVYDLSDHMPAKLHMTAPRSFRKGSSIPDILVLHYDDLSSKDVEDRGEFKVTRPIRSIMDLLQSGEIPGDQLRQAFAKARQRGLITETDVKNHQKQLKPLLPGHREPILRTPKAPRNLSPLRYPGGKAVLTDCLRHIIYDNDLQGGTYVELFAGGAGTALNLLANGHVDRIVINDLDRSIFCFWESVMNRTEELIDRILHVPITLEERERQKKIYHQPKGQKNIDLGFAAFYLNRCNRSGVIKKAGPIGGMKQTGRWKLAARFNREDLAQRIKKIASYGEQIAVTNEDAIKLLSKLQDFVGSGKRFIYADPPYYIKGKELYLNYFQDEHHKTLASALKKSRDSWVLSYDDVKQTRSLYADQTIIPFHLRYSAHHGTNEGGEILISPSHVKIPQTARSILSKLGVKTSNVRY